MWSYENMELGSQGWEKQARQKGLPTLKDKRQAGELQHLA